MMEHEVNSICIRTINSYLSDLVSHLKWWVTAVRPKTGLNNHWQSKSTNYLRKIDMSAVDLKN